MPERGEGLTLRLCGPLACRACTTGAGNLRVWLDETKLAGTGDGFGAPLDLELAKDSQIVPFHRTQSYEQPLADHSIRESLGHEVEYFSLAVAQRLAQGQARAGRGRV